MKQPFIKFIAVAVLCLGASASARAEDFTPETALDAPVALRLSTAGLLTPAIAGAFAAPTDGFATTPGRTWDTLPASAIPANVVPLPEPSSQTALYFLSGAVGLAFVVMRRRTLA